MLNIGRLDPGAAEYYVGEMATSAEDYYMGGGEAAGRWVGSLRVDLGLEGEVDPEHFRNLLAGRHPHTGEVLLAAKGSRQRAQSHNPTTDRSPMAELVDTARAASHLGVSTRYVRTLIEAGNRYTVALDAAALDERVEEPRCYLRAQRVENGSATGRDIWMIPRVELERLGAEKPRSKARPGYDVTLRPPKSVSVLWALSEPAVRAEVRQAHTEAVDEVVRYLESAAVFARQGSGARRLVDCHGVVAAAFDHRTSRAGDPLLHTHVVTANLTRIETDEGMVWRAIAGGGLFEHAKAAGHLYQAHLRHLLTDRLGLEFAAVVNGCADVVGVPEEVIEVFSKRRTEISEMLAESGLTSARAAQVATLETRHAKGERIDPDTLYERWRHEAVEVGFGHDQLRACFGRVATPTIDAVTVEAVFDNLSGPKGLTERRSTFTRSDVIEALASAGGSALSAHAVETLADRFLGSARCAVVDRVRTAPSARPDAAEADPEHQELEPVIRRSPTQATYTTPDLLGLEDDLLAWAGVNRVGARSAVPSHTVDQVLVERPEMSVEQAHMVAATCATDLLVQPISGRPGAGKTYATEAVVAAHVAAGVPIVGCAVSATAAAELERQAAFARSTAAATTVAKLLMDLDRYGGLAVGTVVIVDEASMIATRDLHRIVAHVAAADGAVKLVGDPAQHGPVEAGGVFQRLCRDAGADLVRLVDNNRQQDHTERLAVSDYRQGHIADALARYDTEGKIVRSATAGESFDAMVSDWYAARLAGHADPMIAGPNSTRGALNERARQLLKGHGELTGKPMLVAGREFLVGEEEVARRNDRRMRSADGAEFVKNGSAGVVTAIDHDRRMLTVNFEPEGPIEIPHQYLAAGRLEYGYARTTYGVQGATHHITRYHPTDLSGFEEGYVALTRARQAAHIYVVDGSVTAQEPETHHNPHPQRFDLDDVTEALTRRRTGVMAADHALDLAAVHDLASSRSLAGLVDERRHLDRILATAPPDPTPVIDETSTALDRLSAQHRAHDGSPVRQEQLQRAIDRTGRKLQAALRQAAQREAWMTTHADIIDRHDLLRRAERHRRTQLRQDPERTLDPVELALVGAEPELQKDRLMWREQLVGRAIEIDTTHGVEAEPA